MFPFRSRPGRDSDLRTKRDTSDKRSGDRRGKESYRSQSNSSRDSKRRKANDDDEFDPMDPSAYSDAPKGM